MNAAFLVLLFLLPGTDPETAPPAAPTAPVDGSYGLPAPNLPIPVSTHPDLGGFILGGHFGGHRGSSWQCGWKYRDGSCLLASWKSLGQLIDVSFLQPVYQNEYFRHSVILGSRFGGVSEWYIGGGVAARLDLGGLARPMRVALAWYPTQSTTLELGWDLVGACLDGGIWVLF